MNLLECERKVNLKFISSLLSLSLPARFINARRRIVQPMIDQSNRAGKIKNRDKKQNDPANLHESIPNPHLSLQHLIRTFTCKNNLL